MMTSFPVAIILLSFISMSLSFPGNINISQTGDIKVVTVDGVLYCDTLKCPDDGIKCTVTKKTTPNLTEIVTDRKCYNKEGKVIQEKIDHIANPYPADTEIKYETSVMKTMSDIYQCTNCNETDKNHIISHIQTQLQHYSEVMEDYAKNIQKQLQAYENQASQALDLS